MLGSSKMAKPCKFISLHVWISDLSLAWVPNIARNFPHLLWDFAFIRAPIFRRGTSAISPWCGLDIYIYMLIFSKPQTYKFHTAIFQRELWGHPWKQIPYTKKQRVVAFLFASASSPHFLENLLGIYSGTIAIWCHLELGQHPVATWDT